MRLWIKLIVMVIAAGCVQAVGTFCADALDEARFVLTVGAEICRGHPCDSPELVHAAADLHERQAKRRWLAYCSP